VNEYSPADTTRRAHDILDEVERAVVGKRPALELVLLGILGSGHILIEDLPGLGKTLMARSFAQVLGLDFTRIQFTPDLLPADVTGAPLYDQRSGELVFRAGPVFTNLLLADEINRAPAKVQSALLEVMQEQQVTIGRETHQVPRPFLVMATQNPIESEGTYPLPEAQVDRFMLKLRVDYPNKGEEREILERMTGVNHFDVKRIITPAEILHARQVVGQVYVDNRIKDYIVEIVFATRRPMFPTPMMPSVLPFISSSDSHRPLPQSALRVR